MMASQVNHHPDSGPVVGLVVWPVDWSCHLWVVCLRFLEIGWIDSPSGERDVRGILAALALRY